MLVQSDGIRPISIDFQQELVDMLNVEIGLIDFNISSILNILFFVFSKYKVTAPLNRVFKFFI